MSKRTLFLVVAVLLAAVIGIGIATRKSSAVGGPGREQPTTVSVRFPIPIVESGQNPFYAAQDMGYYAREGLQVRFEMDSRELNPVKTVATNQDTFGILGGPDTLLVARAAGQALKSIAILHRNSNFTCLLTLKSSGISKLEQLQGKRIGFNYGHISTDVLHSLLRKQHIKYTEVDAGFDYNQLIGGRLNAEWAFTVTAGLDLPAKGVEVNVISPASYGIITHGYTIFATDDTVRDKPEMVERFLRATLDGVRYCIKDPVAANKLLLKRGQGLDEALNLQRLKAYNAVTSDSEQYPAGYMDHEMFNSTYERLAEEKVIQKAFDVRDAYTTEFLRKIYNRSFAN